MAGISFASSDGDNAVERTALISAPGIKVEHHRSSHRRPHSAKVSIGPAENLLFVNIKGTLLSNRTGHSSVRAIPPNSFAFFRGADEISVSLARGDHERLTIAWPDSEAQALATWTIQTTNGAHGLLEIACQPVDTYGNNLVERVAAICTKGYPGRETDLMGCIHHVLARILTTDGEFLLAFIPPGLPDSVMKLLDNVKKKPMAAWSLKEAADMAGYSPFHLSRTFKGMVGFGFPEFVDRCRTELAFEKLTTTDESIDDIAASCGFGSAHGLRESVKEYLGLLPSELRPSAHGSSDPDF